MVGRSGCSGRVEVLAGGLPPLPDTGAKRPRRRGAGGAFSLREGCIHFIKNYILYINGGWV